MPIELPAEGERCSDFRAEFPSFPGLFYIGHDGRKVAPPQQPERWTLTSLWTPSSETCRDELQKLSSNASRLAESRVDIIALSTDLPSDFTKETESSQIIKEQ